MTITVAARTLVVDQVTREAEHVLSVRLRDPDGTELEPWTPGSHLELLLPSGLIRHYSLCGEVEDRSSYRLAVLRDRASRGGSIELHDTTSVGGTLHVRGPRNHFELVEAERYLFIAGGIGITPILPMVRQVSHGGADWKLLYGGRSRASMAFLDELLALDALRIELVPQDERGLPDLAGALAAADGQTAVYCCGPEALIAAVEGECRKRLPEGVLHVERFGASVPSPREEAPGDAESFEVELRRSGVVLTVPPDRSILECVLEVVPDAAFSCTEGHCGTCEVEVLEGEPEHHDEVLGPEEREANDVMMICVGRSRSSRLVLDL